MSETAVEIVVLEHEQARAGIAPALGGTIAFFRSPHNGTLVDWLRPAPDPLPGDAAPGETGCFPLLPFSGRIREGRFRWQGELIALPVHPRYAPHAIHGHGWLARWEVTHREADRLDIDYRHEPDAWPWRYTATQRFALAAGGLTVTIAVRNESGRPMPAGLGLHPYFPKGPGVTVTTQVAAYWILDSALMPSGRAPVPQAWPLAAGLAVADVALDNGFIGWSGNATLHWPETGARLQVRAAPPLSQLVVYTPPERGYFCVEPVSNGVDAFNLLDAGNTESGAAVLAPGETLSGTVAFAPG